jgi:DnaK suppressor protein
MPDKKFDKKQLDVFKNELLKIKEDIMHDIKNMASMHVLENKDQLTENAGHSTHMADVASDMYDREFNLGLASNDRELLQKINGALKRIQEGNFGHCNVCKELIPATRLKAIPYTDTCVKCQESLEKKR